MPPEGRATHLYEVLEAYRENTTVLLSDGHDTQGVEVPVGTNQESDPAAVGAGVLFAVPVGSALTAPDVGVQAWALSDRLYTGQATSIQAQVYQRGYTGRRAQVELLLDGEVMEAQEVLLDRALQAVEFQVAPSLGPREPTRLHSYACRATVLMEDEAYTENNAESVFIQVTREKTRVLLLEGDPYWDTRALARLIGSHPGYDLTAFYAFGDRRQFVTQSDTGPADTAAAIGPFSDYDIIILGREVQRILDAGQIDALAPFVLDHGGGVVFARGSAFGAQGPGPSPAHRLEAQISPVLFGPREIQHLRLAVSEAARGNPLTNLGGDHHIRQLPGMLAVTRSEGRQSAAVVLLEQAGAGPDAAAVATLRAGRGVTLAVLTDGLWRWELFPAAFEGADSIYAVFWTRALQWLASGGEFLPGQEVSLTLDRLSARPGEAVWIDVNTRYAEADPIRPRLRVTTPDGQDIVLDTPGSPSSPGSPGVPGPSESDGVGGYRFAFTPETRGVYDIQATTPGRPDLIDPAYPPTVRLAVADRSPEQRDTSARPEVMQALSEATGGRCLALDETQPLIDHLQAIATARQAAGRTEYHFARWPVFAVLFIAFGLEWFLRRRKGLA